MRNCSPTVQLLLDRGAGNGGGESRREPVSHLFTPHVIFTMGHDTHQQICEAFQACMAVLVVISSAHLSHRGHSNTFPSSARYTHPRQASSMPQMASATSKQLALQRSGRCWRRSHLVAFGHVFQANQKKKRKKKNQPPTFLIPSRPLPWYPESVPPMIRRPSLLFIHEDLWPAQCDPPTDFSLLPMRYHC